MSFKNNIVHKNTEINHDLFYSMARNDDVTKAIYESSSQGIIGWSEVDSSVYVSQKDSAIQSDGTEDPNWLNISSFNIFAEKEHSIGINFWALANTQAQATGFSSGWIAGSRFRIYIEYASSNQQTAYAKEVYQFIGPFEFTNYAQSLDSGRIKGATIVVATENYKTTDSEILAKYNYFPLIPWGELSIKMDINRIDTSQTVIASPEEKIQLIIQDLGVWR
jgi:hypothetical protein